MAWGRITRSDRIVLQRNVQCPFFRRWEDGQRIVCESVIQPENMRAATISRFAGSREAQAWIRTRCCRIDSGNACPIARMLNRYYLGEDEL